MKYTPFASKTYSPDGAAVDVLGVGDVRLGVNMKQAMDVGAAYHSHILRDVLYVPKAITKLVAAALLEDFTTCGFGRDAEISNPDTGAILLLDSSRLTKL